MYIYKYIGVSIHFHFIYIPIIFFLYGSIVGGALLVAGLYSVLWGKSRETMESEEEGKEEQKDAAKLSSVVEQA